ncbi:MAG: hypothetical protein ABIT10_11295 [Alteraurantiacibacter sp.]
MKLPSIDLTSLPDLTTLTGMFGSMRRDGSTSTGSTWSAIPLLA